jgi:hypothetical protein
MKAPLRFAMLYERKLILLLCAIAAVRVFIFSAAFPFFNNVDEQAHVDLVMKYARGHVPRDLGQYSSESRILHLFVRHAGVLHGSAAVRDERFSAAKLDAAS